MKGVVVAFGQGEGSEVVRGGKDVGKLGILCDQAGLGCLYFETTRPLGCRKDGWAREWRIWRSIVYESVSLRPNVGKYMETPTWSAQSHELLFQTETEMNCGDMGEVPEIRGSFWEVVEKWGFSHAKRATKSAMHRWEYEDDLRGWKARKWSDLR
jgi:hypothetical protein